SQTIDAQRLNLFRLRRSQLPLDPDKWFIRFELRANFGLVCVENLRQRLAHHGGILNSSWPDVNRLRLQTQGKRLAGAIEQCAALGQHRPFFQMLSLAEPLEIAALQDLQLKSAP